MNQFQIVISPDDKESIESFLDLTPLKLVGYEENENIHPNIVAKFETLDTTMSTAQTFFQLGYFTSKFNNIK